ncbi:MAG: MerR family transcriptional regulator [Spirochaetales bacterium]|nr:MerR family transcriptional regulator [Spirochaetales bacterium]MCF7939308.1 MerR family transcriptional regulator [Spirochaetales bacterium]
MKTIAIGDAARKVGVQPHVLRYWEQEFSMLSPKKDRTGRRVYSETDIRLLLRIRHLLYEEGYTVHGASQKLWKEFGMNEQTVEYKIQELRGQLLEILAILREGRSS